MEEKFSNKNLENIFDLIPKDFNVLEAQIDIETQLEYFELAKKVRKEDSHEEILEKKDLLFSDETDIDEKKKLLIQIASVEKPEAYRIIEKFHKDKNSPLYNWATIALQDSKMLLQSEYLDEPQVFISTGLGGKGKFLRYFVVFFSKNNDPFTKIQRKVVNNELEILTRDKNIEIENIEFLDSYVAITTLLPLSIHLNHLFEEIIDECNVYGNFLENNCLITNVKILTEKEINKARGKKTNTLKKDFND